MESGTRDEQGSCIILSLALPPQAALQHSKEGCPAQVNTEGPTPLQFIRSPKQRNRAKIKEQCKTSERVLSDEEIVNLSDGEFKALVIKMLTELIELGQKNERTNERYPK